MKQNSILYAKITFGIFVIFLIFAIILYFNPKSGKVVWLDYKDALKSAKEQEKPILLYPFYKWSNKSKLANQTLFSDDSIVEIIEKRLIPVSLNLDKEEHKILAEQLKIKGIQLSYLLDIHGRVVTFLDNSNIAISFREMANSLLEYPLLYVPDFETSQRKAIENDKNMLVFVVSSIMQNNIINTELQNPLASGNLNNKFEVNILMNYVQKDSLIISKYLDTKELENPLQTIEYHGNLFQYTSYSPPLLMVISPSGELLLYKYFKTLNKEVFDEIIQELEEKEEK